MPSSLFIIRFAGFTIHDKVCVLNLEDAFKVNACTCHIKYRLSVTQNVSHALIKEHKEGPLSLSTNAFTIWKMNLTTRERVTN